ncbi:cation:proton antiporter [Aeromonas salmonicida]|uniref:cation:proton antiporter n=1 Tax=Aeromonas salmonicida TaxID=645 RepID=UPI001B67F5B9|nr:cation:proton antiporter [Aeromonas sp.]
MHQMFADFALLLLLSALAGGVALWLRQPVLIAYIVVGIVVGPAVLGLVSAHDSVARDQIDLLAQIGVAVLLFVVGLKLDLQHVRHLGPVALATGLGQLCFTIVIGFGLILLLGKPPLEALYVAVALTFSSTIIIVKLLSDKRELDSLHGRIAVGFLIVQDLAVVLAMMAMSTMRAESGSWDLVALSLLLRLMVAALAIFVLMRYLLPYLVRRMARSQELLLIFAIAWGTGLAALGEWAGFSKEAGAFLAGFTLASNPYRDAINARLTGIRDFLLLFFFIDLGAKLDFSTLGDELLPAILLSLFVLIGNPLIVMVIMGYMGYRRRTGFMAGLTVAQISEFSIIFVAMGISLGHVGGAALGLTTLVGLITIALSTYMILNAQWLFERLSPLLGWVERTHPYREQHEQHNEMPTPAVDLLVVGLGRYGEHLLKGLQQEGVSVMGVDFDPEQVDRLRKEGWPVRYGDACDAGYLDTLPLSAIRGVVSTLPDLHSTMNLLHSLREHHYQGQVTLVARHEQDGCLLELTGGTHVIYPHRDAVQFAIGDLISRLGKAPGR